MRPRTQEPQGDAVTLGARRSPSIGDHAIDVDSELQEDQQERQAMLLEDHELMEMRMAQAEEEVAKERVCWAGAQEEEEAQKEEEASSSDVGESFELTYDREHGLGVLPPLPEARRPLDRRECLMARCGRLDGLVAEVLAADAQAEAEGRRLVARMLAGTRLVADVSGADHAAGSGDDRADEQIGPGIEVD